MKFYIEKLKMDIELMQSNFEIEQFKFKSQALEINQYTKKMIETINIPIFMFINQMEEFKKWKYIVKIVNILILNLGIVKTQEYLFFLEENIKKLISF